MGFIDRLKRITLGRVEAFLAAQETPETVLPQLVEELAAKVRQSADAEAKALTAVKAAQRRCDEARGRSQRMGQGAHLALQAGDPDLARRALAAQLDAERELDAHLPPLAAAESALESARAARRQLGETLEQVKARRDELIARAKAARARQTAPPQRGSILDAVARMEEKVGHAEAHADARDEVARTLGPDVVERDLEELRRNAEVERRLQELKARLGGQGQGEQA